MTTKKLIDKDSLDSVLSQPLKENVVEFEGQLFRLRELSEEQAVSYELELQDKKGKFDVKKMRRTMIAYSWVGVDGERLVSDSDKLKTMRRSLAGYLYEECQKLNRYDAGELEDLVKNSEATESSD
jgi:hypothetical protein